MIRAVMRYALCGMINLWQINGSGNRLPDEKNISGCTFEGVKNENVE